MHLNGHITMTVDDLKAMISDYVANNFHIMVALKDVSVVDGKVTIKLDNTEIAGPPEDLLDIHGLSPFDAFNPEAYKKAN